MRSVNTFIAMMASEVGIENAGLFFIVGTIFVFISRPFGGRIFDSKGGFWVILPGGIFIFDWTRYISFSTIFNCIISSFCILWFWRRFIITFSYDMDA